MHRFLENCIWLWKVKCMEREHQRSFVNGKKAVWMHKIKSMSKNTFDTMQSWRRLTTDGLCYNTPCWLCGHSAGVHKCSVAYGHFISGSAYVCLARKPVLYIFVSSQPTSSSGDGTVVWKKHGKLLNRANFVVPMPSKTRRKITVGLAMVLIF